MKKSTVKKSDLFILFLFLCADLIKSSTMDGSNNLKPMAKETETGKIKDFKMKDPSSDIDLEVTITNYHTIISINKREFYFNVNTGQFNGLAINCPENEEED